MDSPMEYLKENQATLDAAPSTAIVSTDEAAAAQQEKKAVRSTWPAWFNAFKQVLPVYILLHLAFLILTYLSALFIIGNFSPRTLRISTLWLAWFRWDSGHFTAIASNGYDAAWRTAFFPLFPLLESIHNTIELSACLFILALVVLCFVGPWRFPRAYWVYGIYAVLIYIFSVIFPIGGSGNAPLGAFSRYMLEVFPAFIVLASIGKKQWFNLYYLVLSVSILSFMVLQFVTGRWII